MSVDRGAELVVLGVVDRPVCGIRDQGHVLADALRAGGASVEERWVERDGAGLLAAWRAGREVRGAARAAAPATVVWQYSPGPLGFRGVPLSGALAGRAARRQGGRVVTVLHELAVDLGASPRNLVLGVAQRLGLAVALAGSDVVLVTTEQRAEVLRRWRPLLRRPPVVVPVAANVVPGRDAPVRTGGQLVVGVFGHGTEDVQADLLLDAVAGLAPDVDVAVRLIGAPGPTAAWTDGAEARGIGDRVTASGLVAPAVLSDELLGVDVVAHLNAEGPTTRKTTLAAALAHGRPVVAVDGPRTAALYAATPAVALVRSAAELADALVALVDDEARASRGRAAAALYRDHLAIEHAAAAVRSAASAPPRLLMVVNRGGNMERRAQALARRLAPSFAVTVVAGRVDRRAIRAADLVYVMDPGKVGFPAAVVARALGRPVVVEVGDHQAALYRRQGRSTLAVASGRLIDHVVARHASGIVVRGRHLAADLGVRVPWVEVPDGVDLAQFGPVDGSEVRHRLGIPDDALVLGLVGALGAAPDGTSTYGWDVVDALGLLDDVPVRGLVVGDGPGRAWLERRAEELGLGDRLVLTGRVPHDEVPAHLAAIDVCVSTQSNDVVGRGRTTAKLPEYLACDRFVLATAVGGAADVLPAEMLLDHDGLRDPRHPARLADRVRALLPTVDALRRGVGTRAIAAERYDYDVLAGRLAAFLRTVAG